MISPLPISSNPGRARLNRLCLRACLVLTLPILPAFAATITGSVRLTDSSDAHIRNDKDYSGAVIWLQRPNGPAPPLRPIAAQMAQRKKQFVPRVLAVPAGSTVAFPNFDPIFHNVFSSYSGQVFDVGLYPPRTDQKVRFHRPGVVFVFCNIHPTMSAVIVVVDTPYMAVSSSDGSFLIEGVEAGDYRLHVFFDRATQQVLQSLERNVSVSGETASLPPIEISEIGYIQAPHKNKYGKDYPAVIEDRPMYPAGRKP